MTELELADVPEPSEEAKAFARSYFDDTYDCEYSGTISMVEEAFDAGRQSAADKLEALSGRVLALEKLLKAIKKTAKDKAPCVAVSIIRGAIEADTRTALAQTQSEGA